MNHNPQALITITTTPLVALTAALPHPLVSLPDVEQKDNNSDKHDTTTATLLASLIQPAEDVSLSTGDEQPAEAGHCISDKHFTYFFEDAVQPHKSHEPIILTACSPFHSALQTRVAYIANERVTGKVAPSSIVIGCTSLPLETVAKKKGGENSMTIGDTEDSIELVRRAPTSSTNFESTLVKHARPHRKIPKRSSLEPAADMADQLSRRWETRSDIENSKSGKYHSCQSSNSSACRISIAQQACPELRKALLRESELDRRSTGCRFETCAEMNEVGSQSNHKRIQDNTKVDAEDVSLAQERQQHVIGAPQVVLQRRGLPEATQHHEHDEFMRRWLQGEERPRSFMLRPGLHSEGNDDTVQSRSVSKQDTLLIVKREKVKLERSRCSSEKCHRRWHKSDEDGADIILCSKNKSECGDGTSSAGQDDDLVDGELDGTFERRSKYSNKSTSGRQRILWSREVEDKYGLAKRPNEEINLLRHHPLLRRTVEDNGTGVGAMYRRRCKCFLAGIESYGTHC